MILNLWVYLKYQYNTPVLEVYKRQLDALLHIPRCTEVVERLVFKPNYEKPSYLKCYELSKTITSAFFDQEFGKIKANLSLSVYRDFMYNPRISCVKVSKLETIYMEGDELRQYRWKIIQALQNPSKFFDLHKVEKTYDSVLVILRIWNEVKKDYCKW